MSKVIIEFRGRSYDFPCNNEDRMKTIAQNFSNKIGIHLNYT